jgi:hypothetical protein
VTRQRVARVVAPATRAINVPDDLGLPETARQFTIFVQFQRQQVTRHERRGVNALAVPDLPHRAPPTEGAGARH